MFTRLVMLSECLYNFGRGDYMDEKIRDRFLELKVTGQRCAISQEEKTKRDRALILFLQSVLQENKEIDFEDVGFCY